MRIPCHTSLAVTALVLTILRPHVALAAPSLDPAAAPAGQYVLDHRHASVTAKVRHLGLSGYTVRFDQIDASYGYDPAHPLASKIAQTESTRS